MCISCLPNSTSKGRPCNVIPGKSKPRGENSAGLRSIRFAQGPKAPHAGSRSHPAAAPALATCSRTCNLLPAPSPVASCQAAAHQLMPIKDAYRCIFKLSYAPICIRLKIRLRGAPEMQRYLKIPRIQKAFVRAHHQNPSWRRALRGFAASRGGCIRGILRYLCIFRGFKLPDCISIHIYAYMLLFIHLHVCHIFRLRVPRQMTAREGEDGTERGCQPEGAG